MKREKKVAIILNPVSGNGNPQIQKKEVLRSARELGWKGTLLVTTKTKNATVFAQRAVKMGATHIIICGGDGSVMEVLPTVIHTSITLGIVPLGTGNLLARNIGLPLTIPESMAVALGGKVKKIDVGQANGVYFTVIAGMGLDAQIMQKTQQKDKNKFGIFAYIKTAFRYLPRISGRYQIRIDQGKAKIYKAKVIMIANLGEIHGGLEVVPATHPQNGTLRIGIVQAFSWWAWVDILYHALTRSVHKSPHYTLLQGKNIEIIPLKRRRPYECDGNFFPSTDKLTVSIYPQSLALRTPDDL